MAKSDKNFEMNSPTAPPNPIGSAQGMLPGQAPSAPPAPPAPTNPLSAQQQILVSAIEAHFVAQRTRAISNLNTYMLNSVGIGEHPDIVGECISLVEAADHAESALQTLGKIIQ